MYCIFTHPFMLKSPKGEAKTTGKRKHSFDAVITAVLGLTMLVSMPTMAQQRARRFGCIEINQPVIKLGASASTFSSASTSDRKVGLIGGFSFLSGVSDRGGWQVETMVHQKGAKGLVRPDDSLRLTYIQGAVLGHFDVFQFGLSDTNALYLIGGPALSFKVHSSYSGLGVIDGIRNIDFNLIAGGGLEYKNLILEARYEWGYVSPFQHPDSNDSFKNRTFAIMVGWRLGKY